MTALPPDLSRLLQILSGGIASAPAGQVNPALPTSPEQQSSQPQPAVQEKEYEPPDVYVPTNFPAPQPQETKTIDLSTANASVSAKSPPALDPSMITTYPAALKYVMKNLAPNPAILVKLQRMKLTQAVHEEQWKRGRDEIIKKHNSRSESSKKLEEIMASLPGAAAGLATSKTRIDLPSPKQEEMELRAYDMKVHKAAEAMVANMSKDLAAIGVPFFSGGKGGRTKEEGGEMDAATLMEFRRKIMEVLEDLAED